MILTVIEKFIFAFMQFSKLILLFTFKFSKHFKIYVHIFRRLQENVTPHILFNKPWKWIKVQLTTNSESIPLITLESLFFRWILLKVILGWDISAFLYRHTFFCGGGGGEGGGGRRAWKTPVPSAPAIQSAVPWKSV